MSTPPNRANHPNRTTKPNFTHIATEAGQGLHSYPGNETTALYLSLYGGEAASHDMGYHSFEGSPYIDAPIHDLDAAHKATGREFPVSGNVVGKLKNKRIVDLEDSSDYGGDLVEKNNY